MALPVFNLPTTGTSPKRATIDALEAEMNRVVGELYGMTDEGVIAAAEEIAQSVADAAALYGSAAALDAAVTAAQDAQGLAEDAQGAAETAVTNAATQAGLSDAARVLAEAARDAAIDAGAWTYTPADETALLAISGMATDDTALVLDTMHVWIYSGSAWVDQGEGPISGLTSKTAGLVDLSRVDIPALYDATGLAALFTLDRNGYFQAPVSPAMARVIGRALAENRTGLTQGPDVVCWGDSLTEGSGSTSSTYRYPQNLAAISGRDVVNLGIGGQTSTQIAARMTGAGITASVTGDSIPATATVTVTAISPAILSGGTSTSTRTITGRLNGVHGTLTKTGYPATYTFLRTVQSVSATSCPAGSAFIPDDAFLYPDRIQMLWAGRNNFSSLATVLTDLLAMVGHIDHLIKRFVFMTILPHTDDANGTSNRANLDAINAQILRLFPGNVLDIATYLRDSVALLADGYTCTADDLTDISNGLTPRGLRADSLHLNDTGYPLVSKQVDRFLKAKGW